MKGKGGKGKSDGKSKGKGDKGKGKDKGKSDGKGKGNVANPHAGKQCRSCGKYGHIAENCWRKIGSIESQKNEIATSA